MWGVAAAACFLVTIASMADTFPPGWKPYLLIAGALGTALSQAMHGVVARDNKVTSESAGAK
jgi:hypothetical protein